jgi:hypothetical protein
MPSEKDTAHFSMFISDNARNQLAKYLEEANFSNNFAYKAAVITKKLKLG